MLVMLVMLLLLLALQGTAWLLLATADRLTGTTTDNRM